VVESVPAHALKRLCVAEATTLSPGPPAIDSFVHLVARQASWHGKRHDRSVHAQPNRVKAFAGKPFVYWRHHLRTMKGEWAPIQNRGAHQAHVI
jgi:hypothetical protein